MAAKLIIKVKLYLDQYCRFQRDCWAGQLTCPPADSQYDKERKGGPLNCKWEVGLEAIRDRIVAVLLVYGKCQLLIICHNNIFPQKLMANFFYYAPLICTPLQMDPTPQYSHLPESSLYYLPFFHPNSSFLQLHAQNLSPQLLLETEPQEVQKEPFYAPIPKKSKKSRRKGEILKSQDCKQEDSEQFRVKETEMGAGVAYKKKNTESNIVNQTFSYLSSDRSMAMVTACFKGDERLVEEYYRLMGRVKQLNKKYINRRYLRRLIDFPHASQFHRAFLKTKLERLTMEEMQRVLRALTFHFLRHAAQLSLLTSAKIYKETLPEHFWRKREIKEFLFPGKEKGGAEGAAL